MFTYLLQFYNRVINYYFPTTPPISPATPATPLSIKQKRQLDSYRQSTSKALDMN